jgi:hypothetical protein
VARTGTGLKAVASIVHRWLAALAVVLMLALAVQISAEESMNPDGVLFRESTPVNDEELAKVHGTGLIDLNPPPPSDVAVILWDEQPKIKRTPTTPTDGSGSQTVQTSIRVR